MAAAAGAMIVRPVILTIAFAIGILRSFLAMVSNIFVLLLALGVRGGGMVVVSRNSFVALIVDSWG